MAAPHRGPSAPPGARRLRHGQVSHTRRRPHAATPSTERARHPWYPTTDVSDACADNPGHWPSTSMHNTSEPSGAQCILPISFCARASRARGFHACVASSCWAWRSARHGCGRPRAPPQLGCAPGPRQPLKTGRPPSLLQQTRRSRLRDRTANREPLAKALSVCASLQHVQEHRRERSSSPLRCPPATDGAPEAMQADSIRTIAKETAATTPLAFRPAHHCAVRVCRLCVVPQAPLRHVGARCRSHGEAPEGPIEPGLSSDRYVAAGKSPASGHMRAASAHPAPRADLFANTWASRRH